MGDKILKSRYSSGFPLDMNVNVDVKVVNSKGRICQHIQQHNKATANMTMGIVKFLRGEFNKTSLNIDNIGYDADSAANYIPSYIGIGNIGTSGGIKSVPAYAESDYAQYNDISLRSEIFKFYSPNNSDNHENHRFKIERSVRADSSLSDTYSLKISSTVKFNSKFEFYDNISSNRINYIDETEHADSTYNTTNRIIITELGLFSGDVGNSNSKLLARMLLDSDTPIILDSTSTMIINWTIGVYSIDDKIQQKSFMDYDYTERETEYSNIIWEKDDISGLDITVE